MPEPKEETKGAPMDAAKKKKLGIIAGVGILVVGYFYFKNKNSSSSSTTVAPSSPTVVDPYGQYGMSGSSSSMFGTQPSAGPTSSIADSYNTSNSNNTTSTSSVATSNIYNSMMSPAPTGKAAIHTPVVKAGKKISGGTTKIAGTTATAKPVHIVAPKPTNLMGTQTGNYGTKGVSTVNATPAGFGTNKIPRKTFGL